MNRTQGATRQSLVTGCLTVILITIGWNQLAHAELRIRIATFNVSLHGNQPGQIADRLRRRDDTQAKKIAAIVQAVRPDLLLVNELDRDEAGRSARLLADNYFAVSQEGGQSIEFPHVYVPGTNTGVDSGLDLNQDGNTGQPNDAWGFGNYPGQYGLAVFSRFPISVDRVRTFQNYPWSRFSGAIRPRNPSTGLWFHDDKTWSALRLSSKNHFDLPILVGERALHLLASHPTPPVFDGKEDLNGCRNHDEIQFWSDYLSASLDHPAQKYREVNKEQGFIDDQGITGGLGKGDLFVIAGDLNSDPAAGDSRREAIQRLLAHQLVIDPQPIRRGHQEDSSVTEMNRATADFGKTGQLRVDYVLPCRHLTVTNSGVFWPNPDESQHRWIAASDH